MGFKSYLIKRIIYSIFLVFFVLTLNFFIFMAMPGDPIALLASQYRLKPEQRDVLIERWGLLDPPLVKYVKYIVSMISWDFGFSYFSQSIIARDIAERLPNTILLMGVSTAISIAVGTVIGIYAASKRGKTTDVAMVSASLITYALPTFWMGMIFLLFFGFLLKEATNGLIYFPLAGTMSRPPPLDPILRIFDMLWHLTLPCLTLTLFSYGGYLLLMRTVMIDELTNDYIVTARAKGLNERAVLFKHAFRNALLPLITQTALAFGSIMGGAIITEAVFTWYGMGSYIWMAISFQDYPVMQATFYILGLAVIVANFIADILYGVVDPRIKYD